MSDTRDREIAELEERLLALRAAKSAPEPAGLSSELGRNPEPEPDTDGMPGAQAGVNRHLPGDPEPEPAVPELPAFMRQYPEPARGPHLMKSASNEAPVLHPSGLGAGASN